ncbi:MAG: hypothetical protein ACE5DI_04285 [Candidatus Micrarchaeia archaeon]
MDEKNSNEKFESKKPHLSVKLKDGGAYVGSAWLNSGQYGKYISVKLNEEVPSGSTLYVTPRKENPELLG